MHGSNNNFGNTHYNNRNNNRNYNRGRRNFNGQSHPYQPYNYQPQIPIQYVHHMHDPY